MTPFFNAPSLRSGNCFFLINKRKLDIPPKEARFLWFSNSQKIVGVFFGKLFPRFFAPKLKGFHMVLQACHSEAIAFLLWALFGGGLESVGLATFFRSGEICEQSVLFSYMAAYGATSLPTNSLKLLFCFWLGPWSQLCDNFWTTPKSKKAIISPSKPHTN